MNGTAKSMLALPGLWLVGCVSWLFVLGVTAAASGRSRGTALMVSMGLAALGTLLSSIGVVVAGKVALWRWMEPGAVRLGLLLALAALQLGTMLSEGVFTLVAFDR